MTYFPSSIARVPNMLLSSMTLGNINRTQLSLLDVQNQLSTGKEIMRPSDDPVRYAGIQAIARRAAQGVQIQRNLSNADAALGQLDSALGEVSDVALQAKQIALAQINSTSSATERSGQATVVNQLIAGLLKTANRQGVSGYVFGGSTPGTAPMVEMNGGFRYVGQGNGLLADLGFADSVPITLGASSAVGATSARMRGTTDLNPDLTASTRLKDLNGARGLGVSTGPVNITFNGGATATIDLTGADTVQDVVTKLTNGIQKYETDNGVTVLASPGVTTSGGSIQINVASGGSLAITDVGSGITAKDLGLSTAAFTPTNADATGLDAKLTWTTPVSALAGVTGALGTIKVNNMGRGATVDLSGASTLEDIKSSIESLNMGLRVEINSSGNGIDIVNEVASGAAQSMSIEEVAGNNSTATRLGIRTFSAATQLKDFNNGKGVQVVDGVINPSTNTADPELNYDFKITVGNAVPGATVKVDLRPQDVVSVQTVLARINSELATQLSAQGLQPTDVVAQLADGANGINLVQNGSFPQALTVAQANNSTSAQQLGLLNGSYSSTTGTYAGTDTAKVRVDSLMSYLIDLRDSLTANDVSGIQLAGENIDRVNGSIGETRGMVGGYAQRVTFASQVEDDRSAVDTKVRSELEDVDFASAASKFSLLQTQLAASLQTTARMQSVSLLDFLS